MFQQRHLNELARVLRSCRDQAIHAPEGQHPYWIWRELESRIASMCSASNPKFKADYFHEKCGVVADSYSRHVDDNTRAAALLRLAAE